MNKQPMYKMLALLILSLSFFSCSRGKPASPIDTSSSSTTRDTISTSTIEIEPKVAVRGTTLGVIVSGFSLSDARLEWRVNGNRVQVQPPHKFNTAQATNGDEVQVAAYVHEREVLSNIVIIGNALPVITSANLISEISKSHILFRVEADAIDSDGDEVTYFYEWMKNGQIECKDKTFECAGKRGDHIAVKVTPFDGKDYGNPVVRDMVIQNMSPVIVEHNEFTFVDSLYTYQVKAFDPDGDTLTYALGSPTVGMTIDSAAGLLKWNVPPDFKGNKEVLITVSDGHGGTASYTVTINIQ